MSNSEKINLHEIAKLDWKESMTELVKQYLSSTVLRNGKRFLNTRTASWGIHNFVSFQGKVLKFSVCGHHHKGNVYLALDFSDTFDVYLTSTKGTIKKSFTNVFIDELMDLLDKEIEFIDDYVK